MLNEVTGRWEELVSRPEFRGHQVKIISPQYVKPFGAPRRRALPVEEGSTQRIVD